MRQAFRKAFQEVKEVVGGKDDPGRECFSSSSLYQPNDLLPAVPTFLLETTMRTCVKKVNNSGDDSAFEALYHCCGCGRGSPQAPCLKRKTHKLSTHPNRDTSYFSSLQ